MKIAIDIMGGDYAPTVPIEAAIKCVKNGLDILLVGPEEIIKKQLSARSVNPNDFEIFHTEEFFGMDEEINLRSLKKNSSMRTCYEMLKTRKVGAVVSAGHSGAMMAFGKMILGNIEGIDRACITSPLPVNMSDSDNIVLADCGANIVCDSLNLLQFGILCAEYIKCVRGLENPTIGLLNIGEEKTKGPELYVQAHKMLEDSNLNFVGNIEGKYYANANVNVIVADGFAGNIFLKASQGTDKLIHKLIKIQYKGSFLNSLSYFLAKPILNVVRSRTSYSNFGGAPLLGLKGVSIVCHGSSNADALVRAVTEADILAQKEIEKRISEGINRNILGNNLN